MKLMRAMNLIFTSGHYKFTGLSKSTIKDTNIKEYVTDNSTRRNTIAYIINGANPVKILYVFASIVTLKFGIWGPRSAGLPCRDV